MQKSLVALAACTFATLASAQEHHAAKPHALFDRLRPLVGTWEATVGGQKVRTSYAMAAAGSAMIENLMPETEGMIDMIHPDGDGLMMTHYCAGANQPRYRATKFEGNSIDFRFHDGTNLGTSYMAGVKLTLVDADHLDQEWTNRTAGKDTVAVFAFTRVK